MKYKRLTKRISDGEEAFLFHSSLHEGIERLADLEDKIESGELCDREEVRKETAREFVLQLIERFKNTETIANCIHGRSNTEINRIIKIVAAEFGAEEEK